jgi:malate dehydrogenase (oxaloacetate-decarboxylating)(NADP+)
LPQKRCERKEYDELIDEFMTAAQEKFGRNVLLQFEDFGNNNAFRLLHKYRDQCCTFNDDIQGTASVVLAGVIAGAAAIGKKMSEMTYLFWGAGSAGVGIANLIAYAIHFDEKMSIEDARKRIWLVDSKGLVTKNSPALNAEKAPFAHDHAAMTGLAAIVDDIKPHAIIGVTAMPQTFTKEVCEGMNKHNTTRPLIFALSNPTSKAECTAQQAYEWTNGRAFFCSGSPFAPVELDGKRHVPGQGNNSYIFPGLALGIIATGAQGTLYPPIGSARRCSALIAAAVGVEVYEKGLATVMPRPADMLQFMVLTLSFIYSSFTRISRILIVFFVCW